MQDELTRLLEPRFGHFCLESGHHGELWLDLEVLCLHPTSLWPFVTELARRLRPLHAEIVCGPLVEGAFVGLLVARELDLEFVYTERGENSARDRLYPFAYRLPAALRERVGGRRVVIVNDVINAGSAVGGTFAELTGCGAAIAGLGALLTLGDWSTGFASEHALRLEAIASLPNRLWTPAACPLCAQGVPLHDMSGFGREG